MKLKDAMIGFVIGDALGVPVEFFSRNELKQNPVKEMLGYGTYNKPPGTYSDDTSLTIATLDSLIQNIDFVDYERIMNSFVRYLRGEYTQYSEIFDIGNTTYLSILKYKKGYKPFDCGGIDERSNGNGSLMRMIPIVFYIDELYDKKEIFYPIIENLSSLTHNHDISKIACVFYVELCISLLNNDFTFEKHLDGAILNIKKYYKNNIFLNRFERIISKEILYLDEDQINSTGYVVYTLEAVLWCIYNTNSYKESVLKAVNLGEDTDTVAAICGSIAGIIYGFDEIPKEWINQIKDIDYIFELCNDFEIAIAKKKN